MTRRGEHAVVLGASMGGLLAARVLSEFYDRVTVVERDELTDDVAPRRGVPQSRQPHVLMSRCGQIAEELFPGLLDELVADGAHCWDDGDLSRFHVFFGGHLVMRTGSIPAPASLITHHASRPFIECHVRRRLRRIPNVSMLDRHDIVDLTASGGRVTGVVVHRHEDRSAVELVADVTVDATGRGSRTPVVLQRLGYGRPEEQELAVHVTYSSVLVRIPTGTLREHTIARLFEPGRPHGFVMFRAEGERWILGAGTLGSVEPPTTQAGIVAFGADWAPEHVLGAARAAEPLGEVCMHRFPANRWRRYDRMVRMPDGLLVLGDAVCSFNPIYGQGMTIASMEALALRDCLRHGELDLPQRFHRASAKKIRVAWQTAVGSDLALPEIPGPRPMAARLVNAYVDRVLAAAESDPFVAQEFLRVTGMLATPARLLRPDFVGRVARASRRRRPDPVLASRRLTV
ncbi:FAD-binding protein [Mycobacterium yunnanensis]|uniref:FAD-binding protein n=1 Tax=Mycobacterium yunnanensis TaxID=368477 RepID=A0A9X2YZF5_9MYCO|nr:FAD-binding protein [Mycobacterium yunnanensis]MCV7421143.1 FAD-binding protein [Mycobacterium yunnanensis]